MEASEPDKEACLTFWKAIWEKGVTHNENVEWLPGVRESLDIHITDNQSNPTITPDQVSGHVKGMVNWSSPGHDGLHAFWIKHFTSLHEVIANQMNNCLIESTVPRWMTNGKTYRIMKDSNKGSTTWKFSAYHMPTNHVEVIIRHSSRFYLSISGSTESDSRRAKRLQAEQ